MSKIYTLKLVLTKCVLIIPFLVVLIHLSATILYLGPSNILKIKTHSYIMSYMEPFFYQNWHLFSPNPGVDSEQIWISCGKQGEFTKKLDPLSKIRKEHFLRLIGKNKLLSIYNQIPSSLVKKLNEEQKKCKKCSIHELTISVKKDKSFNLAKRFASDFCQSLGGYDNFKLEIAVLKPQVFSKRKEEKRWGKVMKYNFGIVNI